MNLISFPKFPFQISFIPLQHFFYFIFFSSLLISCSGARRFTTERSGNAFSESNTIRVLISEKNVDLKIAVKGPVYLADSGKQLAKINAGNTILSVVSGKGIRLSVSDKDFISDTFFIESASEDGIIRINEKGYRGRLKIFRHNSQIKLINQIGLEDYVKGVIAKEMPVGKGTENYSALKAFSICVRTYAYNKISENKVYFDIYPDVRDQVYGGLDGENEYSNRIVDETRGMIIKYRGSPAVVFYSSACGGRTERAANVFSADDYPYLVSVEDGKEPYCSIAPRFNWEEGYSGELFVSRLFEAKYLLSKDYKVESLNVKSRFESGRVRELEIILNDRDRIQKKVILTGNGIRSIIRTSDGKSILRSTLFDIKLMSDNSIIISGKGNGHGVGLCQWGAIGQSKKGIDFQNILSHYFPGTKIESLYD